MKNRTGVCRGTPLTICSPFVVSVLHGLRNFGSSHRKFHHPFATHVTSAYLFSEKIFSSSIILQFLYLRGFKTRKVDIGRLGVVKHSSHPSYDKIVLILDAPIKKLDTQFWANRKSIYGCTKCYIPSPSICFGWSFGCSHQKNLTPFSSKKR